MILKTRLASALLILTLASTADAAMSGKEVYQSTCITCHGSNGEGTFPGVPDFNDPKGVLTKSDAVLVKNISNGFRSPGSPVSMPPKGGNSSLSSEDIESVVHYLRETFGRH